MKVFITGISGQLGRALVSELETDHTISGGDLPDWDMLNREQVYGTIMAFRPDVVIHAAALTNVDYCADHPKEAVRVNGVGTYHVALASRDASARLIAISTNEVFDGQSNRPYQEYDARVPINPYGYSKYVAEQVVERFAPDYTIVRTAWLYAAGGVNFIHKILERARSDQPLRVVTDEIGSPTYASDLSRALAQLLTIDLPGICHLVNTGVCSRYDFAVEILRQVGVDASVDAITSDAFERASTPPPYAPLENVFADAAGITLQSWQDALSDYLRKNT